MTLETKQKVDTIAKWVLVAVLGACGYFLKNMADESRDTREQMYELKSEVQVLKARVDELGRTVRTFMRNRDNDE